MAKRQRKIAEVVSTTPVKDNNVFDQDAYNKKVLDRKQKEMEDNTVTIDAGQQSRNEALSDNLSRVKNINKSLDEKLGNDDILSNYEKFTKSYNDLKSSNSDVSNLQNEIDNSSTGISTTGAGKYVAPGAALNNAIQSNTAAETTGNAVLKAGIDNAETAGQVFEAPKVADEAKKEAEKMQAQLDVNTVNTVNAMSNAFNNMSANQKQAYGDAIQIQQDNQTIRENQPIAPAAYNAVTGSAPIRPAYDQIATKDQVEKDIVKDYQDVTSSIPQVVVEKLGVQDYYPEIGRDIAVGTFSGSRIGSQTIYSGAGGLLPMGLYDARKRALRDAAKEKQAKLDKFMEIPETSEQFNSDYKQGAFSFIQDGMAKHNWDLNSAMKDKEFMKGYYRWQTMGKEITYTDKIIDDILDSQISKEGKPVPYVPAEVLEQAYKFREGKLDNMEDIFSGKTKIMDYAKNIRNYANGTVWADDMVKTWTDPNRRVEMPLNLKTGKEINQSAINEIQDSIKKFRENPGSYDSFLNVVKKYYDLDESLVGEWADLNNIPKDDKSREWLTNYIMKQIPEESIISKVDRQSNNNYNYWAKRGEWAREDKAKETELTKIINNSNNLKLKEKLDQVSKNPNLNPYQKQVAIKNLYSEAGYNPRVGANGEIFGVITLGGGDVRKQNVTLNANNAEVMIYNKATKKNEWVSVGKAMQLKDDKNYFVSSDIDNFSSGQAVIVPNEIRMHQTYTGNNGKLYNLNANNLGAYASTNNKEMTTTTYGNIYIPPKEEGGSSSRSQLQVRFNSRPETSIQDRSMMDDVLGTNQEFATNPEYQGNTGTNYK